MKRRSRSSSEAKTALIDAISACEIYQLASLQCEDRRESLKQRFNLTQREWVWLDGYWQANVDRWYRHNLVYCIVWNGVPIRMNWNDVGEEIREHLRQNKPHVTGHFWMKDGKIGRVFFSSENNTEKKGQQQ